MPLATIEPGEKRHDCFAPRIGDVSTMQLLAVAISSAHGDYVLWFRASTETVVAWAGHPYKNVRLENGVPRLSPRGSFELWRETVRGRCLPWRPWQLQGAVNVRRAVLGGVRRRAAEVQAFNEKLVEFDRAKDRFIASVSHELRTPLHAILGWVELLRSGSTDEPRRAHGLTVIQRNAQAQAQLVDDLIDMSRMANGKFTLSLEQMSFAEVVEQAVESIALTAQAKAVRLAHSVDAVGTTMLGDQRRLQQVVGNLLNNAIKFTPKQGTIELGLARRGSELELTVADSGEGIAPEFMPYVRGVPSGRNQVTHRAQGARLGSVDLPPHRRGTRRDDQRRESGPGSGQQVHGAFACLSARAIPCNHMSSRASPRTFVLG